MAKYKKKKISTPPPNPLTGLTSPAIEGHSTKSENPPIDNKRPKKVAAGSLKLQFAGDLILVKNPNKSVVGLFKRYAALFETLANLPKEQRGLVYKIMTGLMLTSHARKANTSEDRRKLFDQKNMIFLSIVNDRSLRRQLEFKYLVNKNFRVLKYCDRCQELNTISGVDKHKWKYCKACDVDHNFYNLLSMETRFPSGLARLFISNDQITKINYFKLPAKIKSDLIKEEAVINQFHYNTRNLDAINLDSVNQLFQKVMSTTTLDQ